MASQLYPFGKESFLNGDIDLLVDDIRVLGIDVADETYSPTDQFLSDITGAAIVFTSGDLAGKTTTDGLFVANPITVLGITGDPIEALIVYMDSGVAGTSPLIAWFDIPTYTPTGADGSIIWNVSGIFAL